MSCAQHVRTLQILSTELSLQLLLFEAERMWSHSQEMPHLESLELAMSA